MGNNLSSSNKEDQKPRLLEKYTAQQFLNKAEGVDQYRTSCGNSWPNRIARLNQVYKTVDAGIVRPIQDDIRIVEYVPKWISPKTNVVFLDETADGGMPHTRPGLICIPNGANNMNIKSTMIHEAVHISQRDNPKLWDIVYESAWNMKKWTQKIPFELDVYRRYNPDTFMAGFYVWRDKWIVVPVYVNKNEPKLSEIKLVFYNVEKEDWVSFIPQEWIQYFGKDLSIAEQEHPHEMAAYCLQRFFEGKETTKEYEKRLLKYINIYFPEIGTSMF
jgi:hypothetical protein